MPYSSKIIPADRLKAARRESGFSTAKEFAIKNNIPVPTYSAHESGRNPLRIKIAKKYSKLLDISHEWLLSGDSVSTTSNNWAESFEKHVDFLSQIYNYFAELLGEQKVNNELFKIVIQISFEIFQQVKDKKSAELTPEIIVYINKRLKDLGCLKTFIT